MKFLFVFILALVLLLEGSIISLPLVLLFLIIDTVWRRSSHILLLAFLSGIILDIFLVRPIGLTSMYFLIAITGMILYQKKYELKSPFFVIPFSMGASIGYVILFPIPQPFLQVIISTALAGVLFFITAFFVQRHIDNKRY